MKMINVVAICLLWMLAASCTENVMPMETFDEEPIIFPDYKNITIPPNVAPLNFALCGSSYVKGQKTAIVIDNGKGWMTFKGKKGTFKFSQSEWRRILAGGGTVSISVMKKNGAAWGVYKAFHWKIAPEPIDPYIAYRLIEPLYETWNHMGIYQRHLESYAETPIMTNNLTDNNCMNCHSFCMQNPDKMLFHMRETHPCTLILADGGIEKLNTKTKKTISQLVYPSWHPSGRFVAFSVNDTQQAFHSNDKNRVEVFDAASDVVVYDVARHEIVTSPLLSSDNAFETFATFSPDGKTLYFCSSKKREMPAEFERVKYDLCSISFDPDSRTFGGVVDTLFHAEAIDKSVSFPRVSPNGKFLLFTLSSYGNFSIWHKDSDLYMLHLENRGVHPLEKANSEDVDSYHSWSGNSHWIVFSSRRIDGLYTRPHFAYVDDNGAVGKAFLLPQKDVGFYKRFMKSYNIPEFIAGKVEYGRRKIKEAALYDGGIDLRFVEDGQ